MANVFGSRTRGAVRAAGKLTLCATVVLFALGLGGCSDGTGGVGAAAFGARVDPLKEGKGPFCTAVLKSGVVRFAVEGDRLILTDKEAHTTVTFVRDAETPGFGSGAFEGEWLVPGESKTVTATAASGAAVDVVVESRVVIHHDTVISLAKCTTKAATVNVRVEGESSIDGEDLSVVMGGVASVPLAL